MRRDQRVFLIGEDIGVYGGAFKVTQGFQQEFGEDRVIDSPLSETAITGEVMRVDRFGNLVTNIDRKLFDRFSQASAIEVSAGPHRH